MILYVLFYMISDYIPHNCTAVYYHIHCMYICRYFAAKSRLYDDNTIDLLPQV